MYDQIEMGIIKYNNFGKVFVTGDFNSRTSDSIDYLIFDKYLDQDLDFFNTADIPKQPRSHYRLQWIKTS